MRRASTWGHGSTRWTMATETGSVFSAAKSITPTDGANELGQTYHGPVVLVTDARCYSATDIFSAGFADHAIGTILGVDDNTGAGGANVWTHGLLSQLLQLPAPADSESPYGALPNGANMRVAIRRTLRVGELSGTPVEDLGVRPDVLHKLTRADLLEDNVDLLDAAGELLAGMPVRRLSVSASVSGGGHFCRDRCGGRRPGGPGRRRPPARVGGRRAGSAHRDDSRGECRSAARRRIPRRRACRVAASHRLSWLRMLEMGGDPRRGVLMEKRCHY